MRQADYLGASFLVAIPKEVVAQFANCPMSITSATATIDALGQRVEVSFDATINQPTQVTRYLLGVPSTQGGVQLSYTPLISTASYDTKGNLVRTTNEVGLQSSIAYNAQGLISSATAPAQANASAVPVVNAGIASTIAPAIRKVTLGYTTAGDLSLITDAQGNEARITTDTLGRPITTTDPLGYSSQTQYNTLDQATSSTNALAQTHQLSYDTAGRVTAVTNAAGVTIERYTYDPQGRLTTKTDALNQSDRFEYDSSNRITRATDRKGQVTTLAYNERSQVSTVSTPDRNISYQYDSIGRVTEVRDASSVNSYQMRVARFQSHRDLAGFDFTQANVDEALLRDLHQMKFLESAHNVVLICIDPVNFCSGVIFERKHR